MHENSQTSNGSGQARQGHSRPAVRTEHQSGSPESPTPAKTTHGASFDDSHAFSSLRKLQDSSKFNKARFSFRLYKR